MIISEYCKGCINDDWVFQCCKGCTNDEFVFQYFERMCKW